MSEEQELYSPRPGSLLPEKYEEIMMVALGAVLDITAPKEMPKIERRRKMVMAVWCGMSDTFAFLAEKLKHFHKLWVTSGESDHLITTCQIAVAIVSSAEALVELRVLELREQIRRNSSEFDVLKGRLENWRRQLAELE